MFYHQRLFLYQETFCQVPAEYNLHFYRFNFNRDLKQKGQKYFHFRNDTRYKKSWSVNCKNHVLSHEGDIKMLYLSKLSLEINLKDEQCDSHTIQVQINLITI